MENYVLFKTKNGNYYIYDVNLRKILLLNQKFYYFLKSYQENKYIKKCMGNVKDISTRYHRKLLYLEKSGYFKGVEPQNKLRKKITVEDVEKSLYISQQVVFEVTDKCNLECEYCAFGKFYMNKDKRKNKNLDIKIAKRLLKYLQQYWQSSSQSIDFRRLTISFYGGEPLLNFPFIKEIVDFLKNINGSHPRFAFSMTTNGTLLKKYLDFFVDNNFSLLISLDGNEKHNEYRAFRNRKPAYDEIIKNILAIKDKYPKYFENRVSFNAVLHNKNSVSEIYKYFKDKFGKLPRISELSDIGIRKSQNVKFWKTYSNINKDLFKSKDCSDIERDMFVNLPHIRGAGSLIEAFSGCYFPNYRDLLFPDEYKEKVPSGTCLPFSRKIFLTVNGKIMPCERISHKYTLGHVNEKEVQLDLRYVVDKYNLYFNKIKKECINCYRFNFCEKCIFLINIDDENPICDRKLDGNNISQFLSSFMSYLTENVYIYSRIIKEVYFD